MDIINKLIQSLKKSGFNLCSIYLIDTTFLYDEGKFISGIMMALSTMMSLSLPHITVLSKCDLVGNKKIIKKFINATDDFNELDSEINYLSTDAKMLGFYF